MSRHWPTAESRPNCCDLLGDDALPPGVLAAGMPPCAIIIVDNLNPVMIASVSHLR